MLDLSASAQRLYRRLIRREPDRGAADPGPLTAADGVSAVAAVEATISDPAVPGGGGRERLAAALGLAAAGGRASAVLSGPELSAALDLLAQGVSQRLPLVVHLVASTGSPPAAGGGDHAAYHAAAATGAVLLFAANVQEAVDLTLLARCLAEHALTPVVVAMDGAETAFSVQDLRWPSAPSMERLVGRSADVVHPPTASQKMLFGQHRRRVPCWHDPQRPLLHGAGQGSESRALAVAGRHAYFDVHLPELLARATEASGRELGRRPQMLSTYRVEGARYLVLAQGAAVETAEAVAATLRSSKLAVGVVGLRALRPLPAAALVELLRGRRGVVVLERVDAPLLASPPLVTEIRSLIAGEAAPPLAPVLYGLGGYPLRAADLAALLRQLASGGRDWGAPVYLGLDVDAATSAYPKRQVLRDALARVYPESGELGVRGEDSVCGEDSVRGVLPEDALTLTIHRFAEWSAEKLVTGATGQGLGHETAGLLQRVFGGHLRSRLVSEGHPWGCERVDVIHLASSALKDPGDGIASDLALWFGESGGTGSALTRVRDEGCVLLADGSHLAGLRHAAAERDLRVYAAAPGKSQDRLLGAVVRVLGLEGREVSLRQLLTARREMLEEHDAEDIERHLDELQAGFEGTRRCQNDRFTDDAADVEPVAGEPLSGVPPTARRLGRSEAPLADLPAFWDRAGVLYRSGETAGLWPEPFLAAGAMPPSTSTLRDLSPSRTVLPAFDPHLCTGCGACWTACPDSALGAMAIDSSALLEHAMKQAQAGGHSVDKLRMVARQLAARVATAATADWAGGPAGPLFDAALAATLQSMKLTAERRGEVQEAYQAVRAAIGEVPLARTEPFFDRSDVVGGQFLTLAVDPDACKGCELCVAECEPAALTAVTDDARRTDDARTRWQLCAELPGSDDAVLERARKHPGVGPLPGALLSRQAREVMSGGHLAEPGSGQALALRQVLAVAAYHRYSILRAQLVEIGELRTRLSGAIHQTLAAALPDRDLDALARGLDALGPSDTELAELTQRVESAFEADRLDVSRARRLVAVARRLADLEWRFETGESGLGRAPLGLVLDAMAIPWAGSYPYHPFKVPVTVATAGEVVAVARGLLAGRIRDSEEIVRVVRRARRELDPPPSAAPASAEVESVTWRDLDDEEKRYCPPTLVVTTDAVLRRTSPAVFESLAAASLPLAIVVLSDPLSAGSGDVLPYLQAQPRTAVAQSSVAHYDHLERAVTEALDHHGLTVLRVLAASPAGGGFPPREMLARVRHEVDSGAFRLLGAGETTAPDIESTALQKAQQGDTAELAALRRDYEARLATQQAGLRVEMARQVRERLMRLARGARAVPGNEPDSREAPS